MTTCACGCGSTITSPDSKGREHAYRRGHNLHQHDREAQKRERFEAKVAVDEVTGCHLWQGYVAKDGYARFSVDGRMRLAHRVAWALYIGPIPDGLTLDHVRARGCVSKSCVNVAHLEPVTMRENQLRSDGQAGLNARKTHCWRGHEFTPENTLVYRGGRFCRACSRIRSRARVLAGGEAA